MSPVVAAPRDSAASAALASAAAFGRVSGLKNTWVNETRSRDLETLYIRFVEPTQVVGCRWSEPRRVVDEEFDLLGETAADDGVVPLEAHRPRFATEQFFFQVSRDQGVQLLARRPALLQTLP